MPWSRLFQVLSLKASWANSLPPPQFPKHFSIITGTFISQNRGAGKDRDRSLSVNRLVSKNISISTYSIFGYSKKHHFKNTCHTHIPPTPYTKFHLNRPQFYEIMMLLSQIQNQSEFLIHLVQGSSFLLGWGITVVATN